VEKRWEKESISLYEGQAVVFTTRNSKKDWWQVRIKLPGSLGYAVRRSLRTLDRQEAIAMAQEIYLDARARYSQGITIDKYDWARLIDEYLATRSSESYCKRFRDTNQRYFAPFFGKLKDVEQIDDNSVLEFWRWRISYWKDHPKENHSGPGSQKPTYVALDPSYSTIRKERSYLRSVVRWGVDNRIIPRFPEINHPYTGDMKRDQSRRLGKKKRASFTAGDYDLLVRKLNGLCSRKTTYRPSQKRNWERLRLAVLLIRDGLCRPQEVYQLQYRQMRLETIDGEPWSLLTLHEHQSKTRQERLIVFENGHSCFEYVRRYRGFAKWDDDDDLIFASDRDRKRPAELIYLFNTLLEEWGLREDTAGRKRTLYSLRHFAIEQMLLRDIPPIAIAKLAGTSLKMINSFYDETGILQYRRFLNQNRKLYPFLVKDDEDEEGTGVKG
jgi:hypothetical protein